MPEGDTVFKAAISLRAALVGVPLQRVELRGRQRLFPRSQVQVEAVKTLGKHCLVELSNGYCLRVHLGMHGLWNRYRGPRWPRRGEIHLVLETAQDTFVCLQPKEVELFKSQDQKRHPALTRLGPDLLGPEPDWEEVYRRCLALSEPHRPLGEVLLDQRIAAGLGNVYKNELCFLGPQRDDPWVPAAGTSPYTEWKNLSPQEVMDVFRRGRDLMLLNLGGWPRTTTFDPRGVSPDSRRQRTWIYGRQGTGCARCKSVILSRHQGLEARPTHWCPQCQPLGEWLWQ
jgi:endonuclease VIII